MLADHIGIPQLRDMANRSAQVAGEIWQSEMPRLAEMLHANRTAEDRQIKVQLRFHGGAQGFPEISGTASGSVELRCQRCLGILNWPVEIDFRVAVVEADTDIDDVAEPFDTVVAGEHGIRLADVVEDEVLGSLPLASRHEDVADCSNADLLKKLLISAGDDDYAPSDQEAGTEYNQPFAGLAELMKQQSGGEGKDT